MAHFIDTVSRFFFTDEETQMLGASRARRMQMNHKVHPGHDFVLKMVRIIAEHKVRDKEKRAIASALRKAIAAKRKAARAAIIPRAVRMSHTINDLTKTDFIIIRQIQGERCAVCGQPFGDSTPHRDHIISLKDGGDFTFDNVQALCQRCNSSKGSKSYTGLLRKC